jgi:hypothetical protein
LAFVPSRFPKEYSRQRPGKELALYHRFELVAAYKFATIAACFAKSSGPERDLDRVGNAGISISNHA